MDKAEEYQAIARQLKKPTGEAGLKIAHFMNEGNKRLNRNTISQLELTPNSTVLEVGMGNGAFVNELFKIQPDLVYHGVDYSELMISEARRINKQLVDSGKVEFTCCEAPNWSFEANSFNAIFSVNTVYFWQDVQLMLNSMLQVLKPGGQICMGLRPKRLMINYPFVKYGFNTFTADDLSKELLNAGFSDIQSTVIQETPFDRDGELLEVASLVVCGVK